MSHIREISESDATGLLRKLFGEARGPGRPDLEHRAGDEPESARHADDHGVLPHADVRLLAAEPMAPRDARRGHLEGERLLLLRAGARA